MFERRLRIFFGVLVGTSAVLLLRAAQVQVANSTHWRQKAAESMKRSQPLETIRGTIVDVRGRKLAVDEPCMDAAVDYRAIARDAEWIRDEATARLKARAGREYGKADKQQRKAMVEEEKRRLNEELDAMWQTLAKVSQPARSIEDMEQIKSSIRRRVDMRRRYLWYRRYEQAMKRHEDCEPEPWFRQWLLSEEAAPQLDSFAIDVAEQTEAHVILPAISAEVHNRLKKQQEQLPGLVLRPGKHRYYPYGEAACHVLGHLSAVTRQDLENDPNPRDELRRYFFNDLIGRTGIEAMCDQALRGSRGKVERVVGRDGVVDCIQPVRGKDVRITIDIEVQLQIEAAFRRVEWWEKGKLEEAHEMHGAAVVIDLPSGQVRALVSYPTFNLNDLERRYPELAGDVINQPLVNRATQMAIEPGSTVKPMVGLGACTAGLIQPENTIECTGYLVVDGRKQERGRCWVASRLLSQLGESGVAHHPVPWDDPHPNGFLTLTDAIQRSCNVYFETLGEKLGLGGLTYWYWRFGLGRKTGIGLPEQAGELPGGLRRQSEEARCDTWFSAIGQGHVLATPLQMANVAATIARDGLWVRPRLVTCEADLAAKPSATQPAPLDREDLHLSPGALAAVKEGMFRVVNTRAGSGYERIHRPDVAIAGKTGTAQVQRLSIVRRDEKGNVVRDEKGQVLRDYPAVSTRKEPNPAMPWYRGGAQHDNDLSHAWFIGFAPARNPQIAFAVALEYGGSGGRDAAPVANALLDACIKHGYLSVDKRGPGRD